MPKILNPAFNFTSSAYPDKQTFDVVQFHGEETISSLYYFDVTLVSSRSDIEPQNLLNSTASLSINPPFSGDETVWYSGIITQMETSYTLQNVYLYKVRLQHKLSWLHISQYNQIFLNEDATMFLSSILTSNDLQKGIDFELRCINKYPKKEFICQYNESYFDFFSRWCEHLGIYYWFEHGHNISKCIFSDSFMKHSPLPEHEKCMYLPPSALNTNIPQQVITHFDQKVQLIPQSVELKCYNPQTPSVNLTSKAQVGSSGRGTVYYYGDHFANTDEGTQLAKVRAEELQTYSNMFTGISHNPALRAGYTFHLERHFRTDWNQNYLTVSVTHEGSQSKQVLNAYNVSVKEENLFYRNSFVCIPATQQYRPKRKTPKPFVTGVVPATIDAEGSGQYAMLDQEGRYKVLLQLDPKEKAAGKASCWLRMMQPYSGEGMGFHAPLHKGTEVLVSFFEGDVDRPIIIGSVPNPQTPNVVNNESATQIRLDSAGGNKIHIEDEKGKENILLSSPNGKSYIRIGKIN